jgi:hypothetical protein
MKRGCLTAAILSAACLGACVDDQPTKQRHSLPPQPKDVQATKLGVWAGLPEDTNANGYLDTIDITVYVSSDTFPATIAVPGSFEFKLLGKDGKEFAKWQITEEQAAKAAHKMPAGPGYYFHLSILDVANDQVDASDANLTAEFRPKVGEPVKAPMTGLQFGKSRP